MGDIVDKTTDVVHGVTCTHCGAKFQDLNPDVAVALRNNHVSRRHKMDDDRLWVGCIVSDETATTIMDPLIGLRTEEQVCRFIAAEGSNDYNFFYVDVMNEGI